MASPTCPVNCSIRPDKLTPYPDISGIGVNLSYTITAGLALCLVLAYYILAYRPDISPFGEATKGTSTASFEIIRPNPIDNCLLFWRIGKHGNGPIVNSSVSDNRIRSALIRCMLIISDFQLIAGLSTLISGFAQLRCGISTYHWQKIVRLAWFASISHLCCLTFLRDYFCKRRGAQTWRIPGMVLLIIMLIAALVPTAGYDFNRTRSSHVSPFDSAVCAYIPHATSPEADYMVFSALLLAFGMVIRICRLYPKPLHMFENLRGRCHEISHKYLRKVHKHTHSRSFASFLVDMCYYKPLLAIDISCRMALDVATSKAFEVWWLVVSFGWGVLNLWNLNNYSGWDVEEPDSLDWTFGQVIAVLGLLAPIAALIEGYFDNLHEKSPGSVEDPHEMTTDTLPQLASHNPSQQNIPQTESQNSQPVEDAIVPDVYSKSGSFQPLIYAWLMCIATTSILILVFLAFKNYPGNIMLRYLFGVDAVPGFGYPFFFVASVLLSLVLRISETWSLRKRRTFTVLYFILYFFILQQSPIPTMNSQETAIAAIGLSLGFYIWLSVYLRYGPQRCQSSSVC